MRETNRLLGNDQKGGRVPPVHPNNPVTRLRLAYRPRRSTSVSGRSGIIQPHALRRATRLLEDRTDIRTVHKTVEVGLIGKEGFVGLPLIAGFRSSSLRSNVQIEGTAFRIGADALSDSLVRCPTLALRLHQFSQVMAMQVAQIAACNRLHEVEERLAR